MEYTAKGLPHDKWKNHQAFRVLRTHPRLSDDRSAWENIIFSVTSSFPASASVGTTHAEEPDLTTNKPVELAAANDYVASVAPIAVLEVTGNAKDEYRSARPRDHKSKIRILKNRKASQTI